MRFLQVWPECQPLVGEIANNAGKIKQINEKTITGWWCNNHLEKYESQWEGLSHILSKIKNVPNHQPDYIMGLILEPTTILSEKISDLGLVKHWGRTAWSNLGGLIGKSKYLAHKRVRHK